MKNSKKPGGREQHPRSAEGHDAAIEYKPDIPPCTGALPESVLAGAGFAASCRLPESPAVAAARNSAKPCRNSIASGAASGDYSLAVGGCCLGGRRRVGSSRLCGATHRFVRARFHHLFCRRRRAGPRQEAAPLRHCRVRRQPVSGPGGGLQRVLVQDPRFRILNRTHPGRRWCTAENEVLNRSSASQRASGPNRGRHVRANDRPRHARGRATLASGPTSGRAA